MLKKLLILIFTGILSISYVSGCHHMGKAAGEGAEETEEGAEDFEEGYEEGRE